MRRQITPDRPEPADKGLMSRVNRQPHLRAGQAIPFFRASPAKPGIDCHQALVDLGIFKVNHPLNVRGHQATAIGAICLLIASACSKATPEDRIKDLEHRAQELRRDAEDLLRQRDEIAIETGKTLQDVKALTPSDAPTPSAQEVRESEQLEVAKQEAEEEAAKAVAKAKSDKNLAAIKKAIQKAFPEGDQTAEHYILPILQKMIEAEYNDKEDSELDGRDWQYAGFTPANKQALLDLIGNDRRKLENLVANTFKVITNLPLDLQVILAIEAAQTLPSILKAIAGYKKYRKILNHHKRWLEFHGNDFRVQIDTNEQHFRAYRDQCGDPRLHLEYEGSNTSWSIGRAPLDHQSRLPIATHDENGHPLYDGEFGLKPLIRAIHDLSKKIGISTVESIFRKFQDRITSLKQTLGITPSQEQ